MRTSPLKAFIDKDKTKKGTTTGFDISKIKVDGVPAEELIKINKEKDKTDWDKIDLSKTGWDTLNPKKKNKK